MAERDEHGRFLTGCAKPAGSGRQKVTLTAAEVRELARDACPSAMKSLIALSEHGPAAVRVQACRELLDRGYGKPNQPITGEDGGPVQHRHDISRLTDEELELYIALITKATAQALPGDQ